MTAIPDTGQETLESISEAKRFNQWMYEAVSPYLHGDILEIGSGIGNISRLFAEAGQNITLSDTNDNYIERLKKSFSGYKNVKAIVKINLADPEFQWVYAELKNKFDSVFLLNVLEHIEDDYFALENLRFLLKPGGGLLILVPAHTWLFSELDRQLGHCRRYTFKKLLHVMEANGFTITKTSYFNALGIGAWMYGKIRGNHAIRKKEMRAFDQFVILAKLADKIVFNSIGLSAIAVAKKNN